MVAFPYPYLEEIPLLDESSPYVGDFHLTTFLTTTSRLPHDLCKNLTTFWVSREVLVRQNHPLYMGFHAE